MILFFRQSQNPKDRSSNNQFVYFVIAAIIMLIRYRIAEKVEEIFGEGYYWNAIYDTNMAVLIIAMYGIHVSLKSNWRKYVIDTFCGFMIGDLVDRVFFKNTYLTKYDLLAIGLAILIPFIKYLRKRGKYRSNISQNKSNTTNPSDITCGFKI